MGRKSSIKVGDVVGNFTVMEVIPATKSGQHTRGVVKCSLCNNVKEMYSFNIKRRYSCGCCQNKSSTWKNNSGAYTKTWQLPPGESAKNNLYYQYSKSAEKRNHTFDLTKEEFCDIVTAPCTYCGSQCQNRVKGGGKTSGDFYYTGVDRVDNTLGYTKENSVPCCRICNSMKLDMDVKHFIEHIKKIYNNISTISEALGWEMGNNFPECGDQSMITLE